MPNDQKALQESIRRSCEEFEASDYGRPSHGGALHGLLVALCITPFIVMGAWLMIVALRVIVLGGWFVIFWLRDLLVAL